LSVAVAATAVLAAYGCGSSGSDTSVGTKGTDRKAALVPADGAVTADGLRTVTYRNVQFDVPSDWPVYDLSLAPNMCVRFDVHAVYLGRPGADMSCPSGLVGRSDAVLVEPVDGGERTDASGKTAAGGEVTASTTSGLEVQVAPTAASGEVAASIPSAGVDVTLTYDDNDATAQRILHSFRAVGS
jgi:hypothetical protein